MKLQRPIGATLLLLSTLSTGLGTGGSIVVPNNAVNSEGNDFAYFPFVAGDMRYQQVYDASQFSAIPAGGAYITGFLFRPDCSLNNGGTTYTNLIVRLSTTSKSPDQLSAILDENLGKNDMIVYGPGRYSVGAGGAACPGPAAFEDDLEFDIPFFYDPTDGNLLLEVRLNGASFINRGGFAHDAINIMGDSVSRAYGNSFETNSAAAVDTDGLVTEFGFFSMPSLTNALTTNGIILTWSAHPQSFALQSSDYLGSNANWELYPTNQIGGGFVYRIVTIAYANLGATRFFRLICSSCPVISLAHTSSTTSNTVQRTPVN